LLKTGWQKRQYRIKFYLCGSRFSSSCSPAQRRRCGPNWVARVQGDSRCRSW